MANEARDLAIQQIVSNSCDNEGVVEHYAGCGWDAHESAIREKAAALVEEIDRAIDNAVLDDAENIYIDNFFTELAALKAELETPTGKEME